MGNYCCSDCDRPRDTDHISSPLTLEAVEQDEPLPSVAKPVTIHIDVSPKVKEIHMLYK
jgi:hypothetical protein